MLLRRRRRPRAVRVAVAAFGPWTRWIRERTLRLMAAPAVVLLVTVSLVDSSSSTTDDVPRRHSIAALSEPGQGAPLLNVSATLSVDRPDGDESTGPPGDTVAEPEGPQGDETGGGQAAGPDVSEDAPTGDQADDRSGPAGSPSEQLPAPQQETESSPAPTTELSDAGGTDEPSTEEPEVDDPPEEEETPGDEGDTGEEPCLGVDLLVLSADLCLPLLGG